MYRHPVVTYSLDELIAIARERVPFYQRAFSGLSEHPALTDLPVLDTARLWEAHARSPREIVSGPLEGAIVVNTGGSTGTPKFSYFSNEEADTAVALIARGLETTGLRNGDRVANLFVPGYLYASFLVTAEALREMPAKVLQLHIGYFVPVPDAIRMMRGFKVNVWAGFPTHLMTLVNYLEKEKIEDVRLDRIIFGGEPINADQRALLMNRFRLCSARLRPGRTPSGRRRGHHGNPRRGNG